MAWDLKYLKIFYKSRNKSYIAMIAFISKLFCPHYRCTELLAAANSLTTQEQSLKAELIERSES